MKRIKASLSVLLSLSILVLSPGLPAYAATGRAAAAGSPFGSARAFAATRLSNLGPASVPSLGTVSGVQAALGVGGAQLPSAAPSAGARGLIPGAAKAGATPGAILPIAPVAPSAPRGQARVGGEALGRDAREGQGPALLETLAAPSPDFGRMATELSKGEAGKDFAARIGTAELGLRSDSVQAAAGGSASRASLAKGDGKMPDHPADGSLDRGSDEQGAVPDPDGSISPRRQDDGPDSVSDGLGGGSGNGPLFGLAAAASFAAAGAAIGQLFVMVPILLFSLILHEMGHARAARKLGDSGPVLQGRAGWSLKDLATHIDLQWTIVIPLVSYIAGGFMIGGARPVEVDDRKFDHPTRDMALVALAGPAVNWALALAGALAFALLPASLPALIPALVGSFVMINVMLGIFNLIPLFPLDGHHILNAVLPRRLADTLREFYASSGMLAWAPLIAFVAIASVSGLFASVIGGVTAFLLGGWQMSAGLQLAANWMPAMAAAGMLLGSLKSGAQGPPANAAIPPVAVLDSAKAVDLVVELAAPAEPSSGGARTRAISEDHHLSLVPYRKVGLYGKTAKAMSAQLAAAGLPAAELERMNATPIATYKRLNATTLRVDAARAAELRAWLQARGHTVHENARREIIRPVPNEPESVDPNARGSVTMAENLAITKAKPVHDIAQGRWGAPELGFIARIAAKLTGLVIPQTPVGVIDTGVDVKHPLTKRVIAKNATDGPNVDDNGHGTWVASMILNFAPWARKLTSYKAFVDGGATLDDVLKALTLAGNDGNVVVSNSWGSDDGDPDGLDSKLVKKLAEEGHIMVFAAGNNGPRANTMGSPAVAYVKDPTTGALRVIAVAAAGRDKKIARFSSRGLGTPKIKERPGPDATAIGANADGAWPTDIPGADSKDPQLGPIKALSGTSMSTPGVAGAITLLMMLFGVTATGPQADAVVKAIIETLEPTGQGQANEGFGFINVEAAYEKLKAELRPAVSNSRAARAIRAFVEGR